MKFPILRLLSAFLFLTLVSFGFDRALPASSRQAEVVVYRDPAADVAYKGNVRNEGDVQKHFGAVPGPISYQLIVPSEGECENLLVPWCVSSSPIAFGSIRVEPVGMILGQSAATIGSIAIDEDVSE